MPLASQIEEALKLVAETGDRCIIVLEGYDPYIVMDIKSYRTLLKSAAGKEKIVGLTESEFLEKINQDIAEWRESRAEDASEYELSQFRVDAKSPVRSTAQPLSKPPAEAVFGRNISGRQVPNLPIVEDDTSSEYRLEPLS